MDLQDYKGSMDDFTKAIELNPSDAVSYFNRGVLKVKIEDYKGSIPDFTIAIELNPMMRVFVTLEDLPNRTFKTIEEL